MRLNVMGKLIAAFGLVLLLTLGTCGYLITGMRSIDSNYSLLVQEKAKARYLVTLTMAEVNSATSNLEAYILTGIQSDLDLTRQDLGQVEAHLQEIQPLLTTGAGKESLENFNSKYTSYKEFADNLISLIQERESKAGSEKQLAQEKVMAYYNANKLECNNLVEAGTGLASIITNYLDTATKQNTDDTHQTILVSTILVLVIILLGLFIAFKTGRKISIPLRLVNDRLATIASGDLTGMEIKVSNQDEIGQLAKSFNIMLTNLKEIVSELQQKATEVSGAATELSASAENVTATTNETASTITEVSATVDHVATNAQDVSALSTQTSNLAVAGHEDLQQVRKQMASIQEGTNLNAEVIQGLSESTGQITKIVDLITQIADQTNLLALNAAIEAARAGDQGRGFAVVAEEVRKLAEQSTTAAKEIYTLISTIQQDSQKAVKSMEQNKLQVQEGTQIVHIVGEKIEQIIDSVQTVASNIESVASSSEQMTSAVQNVAAATEEQTATMEEVSATSQSLSKMAEDLDLLAQKFKLA